jgi:hypothetical protein
MSKGRGGEIPTTKAPSAQQEMTNRQSLSHLPENAIEYFKSSTKLFELQNFSFINENS